MTSRRRAPSQPEMPAVRPIAAASVPSPSLPPSLSPTSSASHGPPPATQISHPSHPPHASYQSNTISGVRERLDAPTLERVLQVVLGLSRGVGIEMHEEDIVHAFMEGLRGLFPARRFAIRLLSADTGQLSLVYATGRLIPERRNFISLSLDTLDRHGVDLAETAPGVVSVSSDYVPIFESCSRGFSVPLMEGETILGVINTEYAPNADPPDEDRYLIGQIGLQLAAALRNGRLLRESIYLRDYLSKLLEHANAPIVVINKRREVKVVNRAFLALTGLSREEVLGRDFTSLLPESERRRLLPVLIHALRGETTTNFEMKLPRYSGGFARIAMNTASILSADGDVEGVIAIGRDTSEVRDLEEQIIQAEKLATLGQLAAGVVHELNNPLTSISVYADYLLKKGERANGDASDLEKLRRIVQNADRILRFTRDLVVYARPSTEEPRLLVMSDVLEQSVVFCEHVLADTGVRIVRQYGADVPLVHGVKGQLHQVFINLITNACHAMPMGAGILTLQVAAENEGVIVRVNDNGAGIPPDNLDRIFEPFFSTKGEGKGTGLGLSIVRNIVQQHGGMIRVRSAPGEGATFEISFPQRG